MNLELEMSYLAHNDILIPSFDSFWDNIDPVPWIVASLYIYHIFEFLQLKKNKNIISSHCEGWESLKY